MCPGCRAKVLKEWGRFDSDLRDKVERLKRENQRLWEALQESERARGFRVDTETLPLPL